MKIAQLGFKVFCHQFLHFGSFLTANYTNFHKLINEQSQKKFVKICVICGETFNITRNAPQ